MGWVFSLLGSEHSGLLGISVDVPEQCNTALKRLASAGCEPRICTMNRVSFEGQKRCLFCRGAESSGVLMQDNHVMNRSTASCKLPQGIHVDNATPERHGDATDWAE